MSRISPQSAEPLAAEGSQWFVIAGISLRKSFSKLKVAFPKKRQWAQAFVVITATPTRVTFGVTGAEVGMPALTSGAFNAEMPLIEFDDLAMRKYDSGDLIDVELSPGCLRVLGITTKSPDIRVDSSKPGAKGHAREPRQVVTNPLDAPMGLPLLGAYAYIRRHGVQLTLANKVFVQQQIEANRILEKAGKLLVPLGLSRSDLETILDKRVVSGE